MDTRGRMPRGYGAGCMRRHGLKRQQYPERKFEYEHVRHEFEYGLYNSGSDIDSDVEYEFEHVQQQQ
jgi:hypothetical protein